MDETSEDSKDSKDGEKASSAARESESQSREVNPNGLSTVMVRQLQFARVRRELSVAHDAFSTKKPLKVTSADDDEQLKDGYMVCEAKWHTRVSHEHRLGV